MFCSLLVECQSRSTSGPAGAPVIRGIPDTGHRGPPAVPGQRAVLCQALTAIAGTAATAVTPACARNSLGKSPWRGIRTAGDHAVMDIPDQLAEAAEDGDVEAVTRLLAEGAGADAPNAHRRTPLDLAVSAGQAETVRLLLAAGADPGACSGEYGELTPLLQAAMRPSAEVVGLLLEAGVPMGPQGRTDLVPLPVAATSGEEGYPHIVVLFLDRGQDIDVVMKGHTALELAVCGGKPRMAHWLLRRGARVTEHALSTAYHHGHRSPEDEAVYRPLFNALYAARPKG